jgi:hypothetical protein
LAVLADTKPEAGAGTMVTCAGGALVMDPARLLITTV